MAKHIARSHFLGSSGQEVLLKSSAISPRQPHASETQISKLSSQHNLSSHSWCKEVLQKDTYFVN